MREIIHACQLAYTRIMRRTWGRKYVSWNIKIIKNQKDIVTFNCDLFHSEWNKAKTFYLQCCKTLNENCDSMKVFVIRSLQKMLSNSRTYQVVNKCNFLYNTWISIFSSINIRHSVGYKIPVDGSNSERERPFLLESCILHTSSGNNHTSTVWNIGYVSSLNMFAIF